MCSIHQGDENMFLFTWFVSLFYGPLMSTKAMFQPYVMTHLKHRDMFYYIFISFESSIENFQCSRSYKDFLKLK